MPQEILAIIPARGGSKGIPRKNVVNVAGAPLLAHTIKAANRASTVTRVVVSTDDEEVAQVAKRYGADVVWRPAEISDDFASSESALLHVLAELKAQEGYRPDLVVFLQATSPLRDHKDVEGALAEFETAGAESLLSVSPLSGFVWRRDADGSVESTTYDYRRRPRRQDADEYLQENGAIYIVRPSILEQTGNRLGGRIGVYVMDPTRSLDIDEWRDLEMAEVLLQAKSEARRPHAEALQALRLLVFDFDGVITDDAVYVAEDGTEAVRCLRSDGLGLSMVRSLDVEVLVLSKETNPVVTARCRKLSLPCIQSCDDKLTALKAIADEKSIDAKNVAFAGNDVNDLECLHWAGVGIAVADAAPEALAAATWVTTRSGGQGAVREICDAILKVQRG